MNKIGKSRVAGKTAVIAGGAAPAPCHQGVVNSTEFDKILPEPGWMPADRRFIATMPGFSSLLLRSPASRARQTRDGLARCSEIS